MGLNYIATQEFSDPYTGRTVLKGERVIVAQINAAFMLNAGLIETEMLEAPEVRAKIGGKRGRREALRR